MAAKTIPAVTIWQPWATLIALGKKVEEYRTQNLPDRFVGRWMAIHAGINVVRAAIVQEPWASFLASHQITAGNWTSRPGSLPQRAVVGLVKFGKAVQIQRGHPPMAWPVIERINLNDYPLMDVVGRQSVWYLPADRADDLEARIRWAANRVPADLWFDREGGQP